MNITSKASLPNFERMAKVRIETKKQKQILSRKAFCGKLLVKFFTRSEKEYKVHKNLGLFYDDLWFTSFDWITPTTKNPITRCNRIFCKTLCVISNLSCFVTNNLFIQQAHTLCTNICNCFKIAIV